MNVVEAKNITFGENYTFTSSSLLYDANSSINTWGNLDANLVRNNKKLATYTENNLTMVANIFDKYMQSSVVTTLNSDQKEIINKIKRCFLFSTINEIIY